MIIYDVEIEKAIQGRGEVRMEGIEYCKGWGDHKGMGISVICTYDYDTDCYQVFAEDNKQEFSRLVNKTLRERSLCVGFNNIGFDNKVIKTVWDLDIPPENCYDVLLEATKVARKRYSLDAYCEANFEIKKSGNGALAPVNWQQGKIGTVIDYCLNDVAITKR